MNSEKDSSLEGRIYSFLDSRVNTHIEHLELVFKEYELKEIKSALDNLIDRGLIYVVKTIHKKPLYATESKRSKQTPYP